MASRYDMVRQRVGQDALVEKQQSGDAMKRRFARLGGGLGSGAFIKAAEQSDQQIDDRKARSMNDVDFQEQGEKERLEEAERQRSFAKSEREGSQEFAHGEREGSQSWQSGESLKARDWQSGENTTQRTWQSGENKAQRTWQTDERLGSQDFAHKEAGLGRDFAKSEREAGQTWQSGENSLTRGQQESQFTRSQAQQGDQFQKQYDLDVDTTEFNKEMARKAAKPRGIESWSMSGIFKGMGGLFGTKTSGGEGLLEGAGGGRGGRNGNGGNSTGESENSADRSGVGPLQDNGDGTMGAINFSGMFGGGGKKKKGWW